MRARFDINGWPPPVRTIPGSRSAMDQQSSSCIRYWHRRQGVTGVSGEGGPCGGEPRTIQGSDVPHERANLTGCIPEQFLHCGSVPGSNRADFVFGINQMNQGQRQSRWTILIR